MAAGTYDFTIEQGATFSQRWARSGVTSATGYSARADIRVARDKTSSLVIGLTVANGRITLSSDGVSLLIDVLISSTDTAALTAGAYYYDLEIVSPTATVERLLMGTVTVSAEVTAA